MSTPAEAIHLLSAAGATVATCESLTGGMICGTLTSVPGSSEVVLGGVVTYATHIKTTVAGVDRHLIETHGVVSSEVAMAMATNVRKLFGADWGIAVTGVAGPGPHDGVEPGTVWLAVVGPDRSAVVLLEEPGDRDTVRTHVVDRAIIVLCDMVTRRE